MSPGQDLVLSLDGESQAVRNLAERPQLVVDVASPELGEHTERLAPLTGASSPEAE
ncbi:hypothetical protein ACFU3E_22075 [Streptomyces sp. NPDC057424]|uniref:hypothetical protein n=1 Tax=Streptomyces sp. NPDC057424 TaxID=3346127 RepID=UPI0036AED1CC